MNKAAAPAPIATSQRAIERKRIADQQIAPSAAGSHWAAGTAQRVGRHASTAPSTANLPRNAAGTRPVIGR